MVVAGVVAAGGAMGANGPEAVRVCSAAGARTRAAAEPEVPAGTAVRSAPPATSLLKYYNF